MTQKIIVPNKEIKAVEHHLTLPLPSKLDENILYQLIAADEGTMRKLLTSIRKVVSSYISYSDINNSVKFPALSVVKDTLTNNGIKFRFQQAYLGQDVKEKSGRKKDSTISVKPEGSIADMAYQVIEELVLEMVIDYIFHLGGITLQSLDIGVQLTLTGGNSIIVVITFVKRGREGISKDIYPVYPLRTSMAEMQEHDRHLFTKPEYSAHQLNFNSDQTAYKVMLAGNYSINDLAHMLVVFPDPI